MAANLFTRSFSTFQEQKTKFKSERLVQSLHPQLMDEYGDDLDAFSADALSLRSRIKHVETLRGQLKKCRQSGLEASVEYQKIAEKLERWNQQLGPLIVEMQQYQESSADGTSQPQRTSLTEESLERLSMDLHIFNESERARFLETLRQEKPVTPEQNLETVMFLLSCTLQINQKLSAMMLNVEKTYDQNVREPLTEFIKGPIRHARYESQEYFKMLVQYQDILGQMNSIIQPSISSTENIRNLINRAVKRDELGSPSNTANSPTSTVFDSKKYQQTRVYLESIADDIKSSMEKSKQYFNDVDRGLLETTVPQACLAHIQALKAFFREGLETLEQILPETDTKIINDRICDSKKEQVKPPSPQPTPQPGIQRRAEPVKPVGVSATMGPSVKPPIPMKPSAPPPAPPPRRPTFTPGSSATLKPPKLIPPSPPKTPAPVPVSAPTSPKTDHPVPLLGSAPSSSPKTDPARIELINSVLDRVPTKEDCVLILLDDMNLKLLKTLVSPAISCATGDVEKATVPICWTATQFKFVNTWIQSHIRLFSEEQTAQWMAAQLVKRDGYMLKQLPGQPRLLLAGGKSAPLPPPPPRPQALGRVNAPVKQEEIQLEHIVIKQYLMHECRHYLKKIVQSLVDDCFVESAPRLLSMDIESWLETMRRGLKILFGNRGLIPKSTRQCATAVEQAVQVQFPASARDPSQIRLAVLIFNHMILPALSDMTQWGMSMDAGAIAHQNASNTRERVAARLGTHAQGALPTQLHPPTVITLAKSPNTSAENIQNLLLIFVQLCGRLLQKWTDTADWYGNSASTTSPPPPATALRMPDLNANIVSDQLFDEFQVGMEQYLKFLATSPTMGSPTKPLIHQNTSAVTADHQLDSMFRQDVFDLLIEDYWGRAERSLVQWAHAQTAQSLTAHINSGNSPSVQDDVTDSGVKTQAIALLQVAAIYELAGLTDRVVRQPCLRPF